MSEDETKLDMPAPAAHTPGPWCWFVSRGTEDVYLATRHGGRKFVLGFERWGMQGAAPYFRTPQGPTASFMDFTTCDHNGCAQRIDHPDARLIAAAPELLAACRRVLEFIEEHAGTPCGDGRQAIMSELCEAIELATGH